MTTPTATDQGSLLRAVLALAVLVTGAWIALLSASGFAYLQPQGAARLQEVAPGLAVSVVVGVAAVAVVRALLGRRVVSAWLLLGALPAAALSLNHAGVIG